MKRDLSAFLARGTIGNDPSTGIPGLSVQAVHANGDELRFIISTGIRLEAGQRANLVFYPGRDPKKPCFATWLHQAEPESGKMKENVTGG